MEDCLGASCGPPQGRTNLSEVRDREPRPTSTVEGSDAEPSSMVTLPTAVYWMGTDERSPFPADGEGPARLVRVDGFRIAPRAVTNSEFQRFVHATGYLTDAERYGWSYVFRAFLPPDSPVIATKGMAGVPAWWAAVPDASWWRPEGPRSTIDQRSDHPVVHVSWDDATAYCQWAGARLPDEFEWEYAARGGLDGARYPWGDELLPEGRWRCNIWQGEFPAVNTREDGYIGTAPVGEYPPNGYGLHQMVGNVWEWCRNPFDTVGRQVVGGRAPVTYPPRPGHRALRGGSYLCHASYCNRYRIPARTSNPPDASAGNLGFRCVADLPAAESGRAQ